MFNFLQTVVNGGEQPRFEQTVQAEAGERIWVRKKEEDFSTLWECVHVASVSADKKKVHIADEATKQIWQVNASDTLHYDPSHDVDVEDLTRVNYLHEASLLYMLGQRYLNDDIYTFFGDTLLSINPYHEIPGMYERKVGNDEPHVFSVAQRAFESLKKKKMSQSIVINGDSGAGKTEAAKRIMSHLVALARNDSHASTSRSRTTTTTTFGKVEELVLRSTAVLEAFGNAVTLRNDNSSRFGRFVQIVYSEDGGGGALGIAGMSTLHYLLEKSRLIRRCPGERNFHIFYQACAALAPSAGFLDAAAYNYLHPALDASNYQGVFPDDAVGFRRTADALTAIGIDGGAQQEIWKLLLAILSLGNVEFVSADQGEDKHHVGRCRIADSSLLFLETAAEQLNIGDAKSLADALLSHTIEAGAKQERTKIHLTIGQATDSRDALAKFLYSAVFDWVVAELNSQALGSNREHKPGAGRKKKKRFIGILDIFGFEDLENNSFEQVCVNYANELLQRQFDFYIIESERKLFKEEGIEFPDVEMPSIKNSEMVLSLLTDDIFKLLEEQCMLRTGSDKGFLSQLERVRKTRDKFSMDWKNDNGFIIKHFAGEVSYDASGFVAKNSDALYSGLRNLVEAHASDLLRSQINSAGEGKINRKMASKETVIKKFQKDMSSLVSTLSKTNQSFIRCIKPNRDQASHEWDVKLNLSQLNYLGIMQAIRVHQDTYPVRRTFDFVASKYNSLLEENKIQYVPLKNDLEVCRAILVEKLGADSEFKLWQCGYTRVFLGNEVLFRLDSIINDKRVAELNALSEEDRKKRMEEDRRRQEREIQLARERMEREKAEEKRRKEEEERKRRIAEEEERRRREDEERRRRIAEEEEERKRKIAEEEERMMFRIAEEEARRKEELRQKEAEIQKRIMEAEEKLKKEEEERRQQLRLKEEEMQKQIMEEKAKIEMLRQEEEEGRKRLLAEAEEKLKKEEEERNRRILEEDAKLAEKQQELQEKLKLLEEEQEKKRLAEEERKRELELHNEKLKAEEIRLANIETERLNILQQEEERLRKEKEKMMEEQAAKVAQLEAEKARLKEEENRLKHLEKDRLLRLEKDRIEAQRKEKELEEKIKQEKEKQEKLRKKQEKAAAIARKKKKNAEKLKRREAKIAVTTKFQSMVRGAIVRHRYRDAISRRRLFKDALEPNELVVMASLVLRQGLAGSRKYFMVLTSKLRLLFLDPKPVTILEEIVIDKKTIKATATGKREITLYYKAGKLKVMKLHDFLNEPYIWSQAFSSLLEFTTEDYVKIGFERLLKGRVKRSALTVPLGCSHMMLHEKGSSQQAQGHLFLLTKKTGRVKLCWFVHDTDKEISGQLAVNRNMEVVIPTEGSSIEGLFNHLVFILNVKKKPKTKTYFLQCKSKYMMNDWVDKLRYYVNEDKRKRRPIQQFPTIRASSGKKSKKDRNSKNFNAVEFMNQLEEEDIETIQNVRTLDRKH